MVKFDYKNIDWKRVEKDACAVMWLGFVALVVFVIVLGITLVFCVMPLPGKIFVLSVVGFTLIAGLVLRFVFGYGDY